MILDLATKRWATELAVVDRRNSQTPRYGRFHTSLELLFWVTARKNDISTIMDVSDEPVRCCGDVSSDPFSNPARRLCIGLELSKSPVGGYREHPFGRREQMWGLALRRT